MLASLEAAGVEAVIYDRVRVEPTDVSFRDAIKFAETVAFDGIVAVGGGSVIDTAKAVNLYTTYPPADFLDYVNAPIGKATPVPGPLKPLIAIPTTAGTGSETTGVSIFDLTALHAKTGIASRRLKPTLGVLDPDNTVTMPPKVAASSGLDILCHAVESFTAIAYTSRPLPASPALRPAYQGSNPISDIWALQALRIVAQYLVRAVDDPADDGSARADDPGRVVCGGRIWQCGRASPARHVVPRLGPREAVPRAGLSRRSPARPARDLGDPQRAGRVPVHGVGEPRTSSARGRSAGRERVRCARCGRRADSRGPHHVVHAAARRTQRAERARLHVVGHPRPRRGHAAAASRDEAVATTRRARRPGRALRSTRWWRGKRAEPSTSFLSFPLR